MHSHDRTLLAKLGFADPDKKNPDHDLACLYLRDTSTKDHLAKWFAELAEKSGAYRNAKVTVKTALEYHLQKGTGEYATTIGFADAIFRVEMAAERLCRNREVMKSPRVYENEPCDPYWKANTRPHVWHTLGEVKIDRIGIGDTLRQLRLYLAYLPSGHAWTPPAGLPRAVLISPWEVTDAERGALADARCECLKLGNHFEEWKRSQVAA
jgi:hypothetical protein